MLLNGYLRSIYAYTNWRVLIIRSYMNLAIEMKKLTDANQFKQALDLFRQHQLKNKNSSTFLLLLFFLFYPYTINTQLNFILFECFFSMNCIIKQPKSKIFTEPSNNI